MKKLLIFIAFLASPLLAAASISIYVGDPGYYGQILIDNRRPPVVYANPIIVNHAPGIAYQPLYLRVPPGHYQHWARYCHTYASYNACHRPVYFVRDDWYRDDFAPHYRHHHGRGYDSGSNRHGHDRHHQHNKHGRWDTHR